MDTNLKITTLSESKKIIKPWGYEIWLAEGFPSFKYALKEIHFNSNFKTSIQFHEFKEETSYVQKGEGIFYYSELKIDVEKFKKNDYSKDEIKIIINTLKKKTLTPGIVIHIKPGIVHRVESIDNLVTLEASSVELDDVYRLNDEWNRNNGKIDSEHK
jgi:mannose-6-phosphate isomerase